MLPPGNPEDVARQMIDFLKGKKDMTLIEIANEALANAIAKANAADDYFESAIRAAGYKSRWDWKVMVDERPLAAYLAKVKADKDMHEAFEKTRQLSREPGHRQQLSNA